MVGGGPAGAAAAIALAQAGVSAVVLEAASETWAKVGESLPPSANPALDRLGLTDVVSRCGLPSYGNRSVWGSVEPVDTDFVFGTAGSGWRVDRALFEAEAALVAIAAGADWRYGARVVGCVRGELGGWKLQVADGAGARSLHADVVVDGSGRAARVARLMGARRVRYDRLVGAVAYGPVRSGVDVSDLDSTTLVEAVPQGWWYSMFLPGQQLVVGFMTDADLLDERGARTSLGLGQLLEAAPQTAARVSSAGGFVGWPEPHIRPAHTSRLTEVTGPDWLAVGDAAITYDPLTSYGITAALGHGIYAAAAVVEHLAGRPDALPGHTRLIDGAFARYLGLLHDRYAVEQRWPDAPFWQRRHCPQRLESQA